MATLDPAQDLETRLHQLTITYPDHIGDASLLDRLTANYHNMITFADGGDGGRRPAGPRPPGPDAAMLTRDEIERSICEWADALAPGERHLDPAAAARLLPTLAVQSDGGMWLGEVHSDALGWDRTALLVLGLEDAPVGLRGAVCPGCHRQSIMFDRHATLGDLWCGRGGWAADACHDDERFPNCRDRETGVITCRRSPRAVRHHRRWSHGRAGELHPANTPERAA